MPENENVEKRAPEIREAHHYFASGKFPESELVIGLVGAVGTGLRKVVADLTTCLKHYAYEVHELHVSEEIIGTVVEVEQYGKNDEYVRISKLMNGGDAARKESGDNAVLAMGAASLISATRKRNEADQPVSRGRHAYVINSLKHPDEVTVLKHIYGDGFFLLGVYSDPDRRRVYLTDEKKIDKDRAKELMDRDEKEEGKSYGQRTRDTFHLADFFLHLDANEDRRRKNIQRILNLVFGHPYVTPTFDEFAMFMAFCASLRSADLGRQVGAVIARDDEILAMGANDSPRFGGGLYWPYRDPSTGEIKDFDDGRDHTRGIDSNDEQKALLVNKVLKDVQRVAEVMGDEETLRRAIAEGPIDDITEYGRAVHAEMEALLTCSRNSMSSRRATLYCTTFPCHNCAKHIIAAGVERVVYVEPYPKSKALAFHKDAAFLGFRDGSPEKGTERNRKVAFEPFVGVGPRRFFDLFSMKHGSGYPLERKDKTTGRTLPWSEKDGILRMPMVPWAYLQREELAAERFKGYGRRLRDE